MASLVAVAGCLLAGLALARLRVMPTGAAALNAYAIHVALPALIVRQIAALELGADALLPALVPWAVLVASAGVVLAVARARRWSREVTGALLLVVPLGNTAFLGLPLTQAALGAEALPFAVIYDQAGSFLALTLYGSFIAHAYAAPATDPREQRARRPLVEIVTFPPFLALLVGLAAALLLPAGLPPIVDEALAIVAASLVPTVLVAVGLGWRLVLPRAALAPWALALVVKLALAPLVAWVIVGLTGGDGIAADVVIVQSAMGPMITAGAIATARGMAPDLVAAIVGYGTLLSLGSVFVVRALLIA
ncbi:MAG: AEC family transporter [Deltaproteobacteria bacterium]|nr:AEC family transporter [Deltaproteobacteria bacterium]